VRLILLEVCAGIPPRKYIAFVGREHDDTRVRVFLADCDDGVDPAHIRHLDVHEGDVRSHAAELR
jgi:hypothetical protein